MADEFQSNNIDSVTQRNRKWSVVDSIARWTVGVLVIAAGLYFINDQMRPPVSDEDLTINIVESGPSADTTSDESSDGGNSQTDTDSGDSDPEDPTGLTSMISTELIESAEHPMDPLLEMADRGLEIIDNKYQDYTAKIISQVRTGKTLHDKNAMFLKLRHAREANDSDSDPGVPFSVYTRFLSPKSKAGQEAIWVQGRDDGKILGHGTGLMNVKTVRLDPEGSFAMNGNRYPISQIGFRNLVVKMKEFGENDRDHDECEIEIDRNVKVDDRPCTLITVTHPIKRDHFEYHIAQIYIDNEYEIPTGYEGYLWPEAKDGEPVLLESYFYIDINLDVGLEDIDFDTSNPDYDYPAW